MVDVGRSTAAHVEDHAIESSAGWVELEHWALWSNLLKKPPNQGFPYAHPVFRLIRERYREEGQGQRVLRPGEYLDDDRGVACDKMVAGCKPIYRDIFLLSFEMRMGDTQAARFLSRVYCISRDRHGQPLEIDRKAYRATKYEGVAAFDMLLCAFSASA